MKNLSVQMLYSIIAAAGREEENYSIVGIRLREGCEQGGSKAATIERLHETSMGWQPADFASPGGLDL